MAAKVKQTMTTGRKATSHVPLGAMNKGKTMRSTAPAGLKPARTSVIATKSKPKMQGGSTGNIKVSKAAKGPQTGGKGKARTNAGR